MCVRATFCIFTRYSRAPAVVFRYQKRRGANFRSECVLALWLWKFRIRQEAQGAKEVSFSLYIYIVCSRRVRDDAIKISLGRVCAPEMCICIRRLVGPDGKGALSAAAVLRARAWLISELSAVLEAHSSCGECARDENEPHLSPLTAAFCSKSAPNPDLQHSQNICKNYDQFFKILVQILTTQFFQFFFLSELTVPLRIFSLLGFSILSVIVVNFKTNFRANMAIKLIAAFLK